MATTRKAATSRKAAAPVVPGTEPCSRCGGTKNVKLRSIKGPTSTFEAVMCSVCDTEMKAAQVQADPK